MRHWLNRKGKRQVAANIENQQSQIFYQHFVQTKQGILKTTKHQNTNHHIPKEHVLYHHIWSSKPNTQQISKYKFKRKYNEGCETNAFSKLWKSIFSYYMISWEWFQAHLPPTQVLKYKFEKKIQQGMWNKHV